MQQKKRRTFILLFCTPNCSCNALCANTSRFYTYGLVFGRVKMLYRKRLHTQPNKTAVYLALFLNLLLKRVEVVGRTKP